MDGATSDTRWSTRVTLGALLCAALVVGGLVLTDSDVSATPEVRNDLLFRAARTEAPLTYRHDDPSGYVQFFPGSVFVHRAWRSGEVPLWNPYSGGGFSPLRRLQDAIFHPLRLASLVVPERQAESFAVVFAVALAYAGTCVLLLRLGRSRQAAVVTSGAFALSAHMCTAVQVEFPVVYAGLPWLAAAFDAVLLPRVAPRGAAVGAALLVAVTVAGPHPGVALAVVAFASLIAVARAVSLGAARHLWRLPAMGLAGVALGAAAWVPFVFEVRTGWTYKYPTTLGTLYAPISWKWWPSMVAGLVDVAPPGTYGELMDAFAWLGIPVAALAVAGLGMALIARIRFVVVVVVVAFAFAMPGPWMEWARSVPGLWTLKVWYLFGILPLAATLAAALAWDGLIARAPILGRGWLTAVVALLIATAGPARSALWVRPNGGAVEPPSAVLQALRREPGPLRVTAPPGHVHLQNLASITRIDDVRTHGATLSRRYHRWFSLIDPQVLSRAYPSTRVTPRVDHALMRSFHVGYALEPALVTNEWKADPQGAPTNTRHIEASSALELMVDDGWVKLWRIPAVRPRVDAARALVVVHDVDAAEAALRRMSEADIDTHDVVEVPPLVDVGPRRGRIELHAWSRPSLRTLRLRVTADAPALVVVQELYEDGWTATVDGEPAPVWPTNLVARGVPVPAGTHDIELSYVPPGFVAGVVCSVATLCGLLGFVFLRRRPDPQTRDTHTSPSTT